MDLLSEQQQHQPPPEALQIPGPLVQRQVRHRGHRADRTTHLHEGSYTFLLSCLLACSSSADCCWHVSSAYLSTCMTQLFQLPIWQHGCPLV